MVHAHTRRARRRNGGRDHPSRARHEAVDTRREGGGIPLQALPHGRGSDRGAPAHDSTGGTLPPSAVPAAGTTGLDGAGAGKAAHYMLRWVSTTGEKGPWSEMASATVGA